MFYRVVVQAVLLLSSESWVMSEEMEKTVQGAHTSFLYQITGNWVRRNTGRTWVTPSSRGVGEVAVINSEATYIGRRQGTMAQWVALRPTFKV